jgi:CheY-like chemotaxis protein
MSEARVTILLIEDNPIARRLARAALRSAGYDAVFAADGVSAISQAQKELPDLILLDLGLPAGDGFVALQRLKAIPRLAPSPSSWSAPATP